ncbi:hypothetical protein NX059_003221 [Plenodomus lindquistii]|nr:hypothetical protein NX059_003221 [Plenodomus lindquistii]
MWNTKMTLHFRHPGIQGSHPIRAIPGTRPLKRDNLTKPASDLHLHITTQAQKLRHTTTEITLIAPHLPRVNLQLQTTHLNYCSLLLIFKIRPPHHRPSPSTKWSAYM